MNHVKLYNGHLMPIIGLGTFKIRGSDLVLSTLDVGLSQGYRSIDTASVYRNEEDIGQSLKILMRKHGLKREDLFITSKLSPRDQGSGKCRSAFLASLERLDLDYLDLYLIHWPGAGKIQPNDPRNQQLRAQSWADMEQLVKEGKLKAIGVSNYTTQHLQELLEVCEVKPAVLQVECHPHLTQDELRKLCREHNVHFQAYSSLGSSTCDKLLRDKTIVDIAKKCGRSAAQVLLRWATQQGIGVLPKSTDSLHIRDNIDILNFELSEEDLRTMNKLNSSTHYCWNPDKVT